MTDTRNIAVTVNGARHDVEVETRLTLADCLRHQIGLTGTHVGCEHGVCGACTVRVDGRAVRACLIFAVQAEGCQIDTAAGLTGADGALNPLQAAFKRNHALQCGYCTPGILMSVTDFLERNPNPSEAEVEDMLSGHICRCTGYVGIMKAVMEVAAAGAAA